MPVIIFKEPSCKLKTSNGLFLLKGNYEINIVDEAILKDLKKHNPEFDVWVQKGFLTINEKEDNVKADGLLMQEMEHTNAQNLGLARMPVVRQLRV